MGYLEFREKLLPLGCFHNQQVLMWFPMFNRTNYHRWIKEGKICRLRNGLYAFTEIEHSRDFVYFAASEIYKPSYISLQTALSYYGIIPETVVDVTCVSTLKSFRVKNDLANYSYQTMKPSLFWGYVPKQMADGRVFYMAEPEKAILDYLYLNPNYQTLDELEALRFDSDFMEEDLNLERLKDYLNRFNSRALTSRVNNLLKLYDL